MSVFPVEVSKALEKLVNEAQLKSAKTIDEATAENCLIKAYACLERSDNNSATRLFEQISKPSSSSHKSEESESIDLISTAAQVELVLISPIKYFNDKTLIKSLTQKIKRLPKDRLLARLYHALAILMQWRRNTPQALKYLFNSQDIYREVDEAEGLARILDTLGSVSTAIADHEQALLYYAESLALKTFLKDTHGQAITLGNLGRLCLQLGRYQQARSFVELDITLCENAQIETKARLLNLLARIDIADHQWSNAEQNLDAAVEILDKEHKDSLFFCIKDQVLLFLEKNTTSEIKSKISRLSKLLPEKSDYHAAQLQLVKNRFEHQTKGISIEKAEPLLELIEDLELPEMELEYRLWLAQLANDNSQPQLAQQHLLLSRKLAKMTGFKRFIPKINSLMHRLEVIENINEEVLKTISNDIEKIDDGYLIRSKLGGGGFGDVFLAHDMTNDRDVALKRFHAGDLMDHRQQKKRWNQARLEFEAVSGLCHPSIAKIHAIGHDSTGSPYLVQEFVSGGDITKIMANSKDLSSALTYLIPITRALAAIHEVGVIAHSCGIKSPREFKRFHARVVQENGRSIPLDEMYPDK